MIQIKGKRAHLPLLCSHFYRHKTSWYSLDCSIVVRVFCMSRNCKLKKNIWVCKASLVYLQEEHCWAFVTFFEWADHLSRSSWIQKSPLNFELLRRARKIQSSNIIRVMPPSKWDRGEEEEEKKKRKRGEEGGKIHGRIKINSAE